MDSHSGTLLGDKSVDFSKLVDWIKLSPKYLFAIAAITGFLLFAPTGILTRLGLTSLVDQYRAFIGVLFVVSCFLFLVHPLATLYELLSTRAMSTMLVRDQQKSLSELTEKEKQILRGYIFNKTQSQYLSPFDGVTTGLEAKRIIYRAANIGQIDRFAYNIQPWAWKYLNDNPELLEASREF